jgi:hypothetical protein
VIELSDNEQKILGSSLGIGGSLVIAAALYIAPNATAARDDRPGPESLRQEVWA